MFGFSFCFVLFYFYLFFEASFEIQRCVWERAIWTRMHSAPICFAQCCILRGVQEARPGAAKVSECGKEKS
jgi:hypothetical protein